MNSDEVLRKADNLYRTGKYSEAICLYDSARFYRKDRYFQAFINLNIAQCLRRQGHSNEALHTASYGLDLLPEIPVMATRGELLVTYGNSCSDCGNHLEAIDAFERAIRVFAALNHRDGILQVIVCQSRSLVELSRLEEARQLLLAVLKSADLPLIIESQAISNLASIVSREDLAMARELFEKELVIHDSLDDEFGRSGSLINLALIEMQEGNLSKAAILLTSAKEVATKINASEYMARCLRLLQELECLRR